MGVISDNLKFLRKTKGFTQEQMAEQIGIKRSLLGAYEEGRAEPPIENLINITKIFNISIDDLISKNFKDVDLTVKKPVTTAGAGILVITTDNGGKENIELVPQKASAGYLNGFADPEYIQELPRFQLPILKQGTYRAFEISGDSMLPLQPGDIVIGQYVEHVNNIRNGKTYVIVSGSEGVVYKRVFNYIEENGKLFLVSDNKQYSSYHILATDVHEVWEAKAFISINLPEPGRSTIDDGDLSLQKLAGIVMQLQQEVIKLKDR